MTDEVTQTPLQEAQKRLATACMATRQNPGGAAISAFVNSLLTAARVDALAVMAVEDLPNASWTRGEWLEHLTARHTNQKAEELEAHVAQPRLVSSNGSALIHQS